MALESASTYANAYCNTHPNGDSHPNADTNTYLDASTYRDLDEYRNPIANEYTCADGHSDANTIRDCQK